MGNEQEKMDLPPYGNTGAENTGRVGLRACVDWLSVTFKNVQAVHQICDLIGVDFDNFHNAKTGGKGYLRKIVFAGISIYYEGKENMGIHVEMTGQGCRHFEKYSRYDWLHFFSLIMNTDINITRLDLAIDDFHGYFTLKQITEKIRRKCVRSRFKDAIEIKKTRLSDAKNRGRTIYFGSASSMVQVRFYDKLLERQEAGKELEEGITFWQRTELQLRDDRAMAAMLLFVNMSADTGKLASGILKNYISFLIEDKTQKNKSRWKVCKWWERFLGEVEKLPLTIIAPDVTIERSYKWLDHQVEKTLAMMYEAFNQDMTIFFDLINKGIGKLENKDKDIIKRFKEENKNITYDDFLKKQKKDLNL